MSSSPPSFDYVTNLIRSLESKTGKIYLQGERIGLAGALSPGSLFKTKLIEKKDISLTKKFFNDSSLALQCYSLQVLLNQSKDENDFFPVVVKKMEEFKGKQANYMNGFEGKNLLLTDYLFLSLKPFLTDKQKKSLTDRFESLRKL